MSNYKQITNMSNETHFSASMNGDLEMSRMFSDPTRYTTLNAGDIVPLACWEVLPHESFDVSILDDSVIRQTTLKTPTMGSMEVDFYAFFVPNRVVNQSWKAVEGENYNGSWTANHISLAPLVSETSPYIGAINPVISGEPRPAQSIPVGSVADYFDFPTQQPIPREVLMGCHDLKFRGYVMIYNEYFRDQNYQPPVPMSTLNVYQGFLDYEKLGASVLAVSPAGLYGTSSGNPEAYTTYVTANTPSDGSMVVNDNQSGAIAHALFGSGGRSNSYAAVPIEGAAPDNGQSGSLLQKRFRAYNPPFKANKLHDYFTSVLPSPQKSLKQVFVPLGSNARVYPMAEFNSSITAPVEPIRYKNSQGTAPLYASLSGSSSPFAAEFSTDPNVTPKVFPSNLGADLSQTGIDLSDLRTAAAIQQVYECLARGGSRYREIVRSFFGIEVDDPYMDIPKRLGHIRRTLDLYQVAQTSATQSDSAQAGLAAYGYSTPSGHLFHETFLEHGYIHIYAVIRQRNVYSSLLDRDNFRLNMLDFYLPQLANISEQPVYTKQINPFSDDPDGVFGYQEYAAEYRYDPDRVSGFMRPGVPGSLSVWNYSDEFDSGLKIADGKWLKSNAQEVLDRTLQFPSLGETKTPQFKAAIHFGIDKQRAMPTYSVPAMDVV